MRQHLEHRLARGQALRPPGRARPVLREDHEPHRERPRPAGAAQLLRVARPCVHVTPARAADRERLRERVHAAAAVEDRELVRQVQGAGLHQLGHERRLAAAAAARDHDRPAAPAHDAGVDERPALRAGGDALADLGFQHREGVGEIRGARAAAAARVNPARAAGTAAAGIDPDGEDLVDDRRRTGPPAGRQVRTQPIEERGGVRAHSHAQAVGGEARAGPPAQAVDSSHSRRAPPQARHHARQAPHRRVPSRAARSLADSTSRPIGTTRAGSAARPSRTLYIRFSRLKRHLHLFSSSVTLGRD